ncbi:glycoside hydrolase family 78 protein [Microbacterium thalassium]|uniref:alpha-L-rhamnosidase n=1 Tax=Microbacterium thalassium TaxID=362649 RepID=A0A7X0FNF3_9MICO|nr:glycoside hydrolase family 78 protein [Microbacterium thalassium]MBB6390714.1 alpha-L-rhamnosidase [Microbacterium thalassium]GLK25823.1 alpha-L-rhamnosidase [Microbacterium thalassium]
MTAAVRPVTIEHHREPLGIGESHPRLSWVVDTDEAGWRQRAYEIEVSVPEAGTETFTSGRVDSDAQVLVDWPVEALPSRARRSVRVRVWGPDDAASAWSDPTALETGLTDPALWTASLVAPGLPAPGDDGEPAMLLRGEATLGSGIRRARIRATAHGVMTLHLNGETVGEDVLHPGWTSYVNRLRYRTWDVTDQVREGVNALGVHLADGWYRGFLGFGGLRDTYGDRTAALVQLEVEHEDGSLAVFGTDGTWRWAPGPVTRADLYMGETFDARRAVAGWSEPGFDDSAWRPVSVVDLDPATVVAPDGPAVRRTASVRPVAITTSPAGRTLVDFGQNLVGRLRVRVPAGEPGTTITLRHAEVLEDGELGTRPLRRAKATDEVVIAGGAFTWEPAFTFHGFRYAEVEGWPGELTLDDLEAVVVHTDMRRLGAFEASDPLLTRLHENVVWGMRGNFLDVPTDCPQRDERLGWTGDLQVFAPTASFLYDTSGMLTGWLADLAADQTAEGNVPVYVPWAEVDPHLPPLGAEAGWGDAATVVPWTLYERYGDVGILRRQWASMTSWTDFFAARAGDEIDFPGGGFSFGDWLDSAAPDDQPWAARLPWQAVATAYLARSARIVRDTALLLGDESAAARYDGLFDRAATRFRTEYVTPSGRAAFPSQTAYALGIAFDLLLPDQRQHAGSLLADQVAADGFHVGSGFLGTPVVCDALADTGHAATAWRLLLQQECPSWLYAVTMGATTIWERWNSMLPDGSINPGEMTSFNHYAFGAIADFLHRRVAGLAPDAPGYRRLRIAPVPTPELTWARASHETPYGRAAVSWTLDGEDFALEVVVPPSTEATVQLPDGSAPIEVASGTHTFTCRFAPESAASAPAAFSAA